MFSVFHETFALLLAALLQLSTNIGVVSVPSPTELADAEDNEKMDMTEIEKNENIKKNNNRVSV